jgi:hypothetical protein
LKLVVSAFSVIRRPFWHCSWYFPWTILWSIRSLLFTKPHRYHAFQSLRWALRRARFPSQWEKGNRRIASSTFPWKPHVITLPIPVVVPGPQSINAETCQTAIIHKRIRFLFSLGISLVFHSNSVSIFLRNIHFWRADKIPIIVHSPALDAWKWHALLRIIVSARQ